MSTRRLILIGLSAAVILVWATVAGLWLFNRQRTAAALTPTPTQTSIVSPSALLSATITSRGLAVQGSGWPRETVVVLSVAPVDGRPAVQFGTVKSDGSGSFGTEFALSPDLPLGEGVRLMARAGDVERETRITLAPPLATPTTPSIVLATATSAPLPPTTTPAPPPSATQAPALPTATLAPASPAPLRCVVLGDLVNLRAGPETTYPILVSLRGGTGLDPVARNAEASWLQVITAQGVQGWANASFLNCTGAIQSLRVVQVVQPPTATATARPAATLPPTLTPVPPTLTPVPPLPSATPSPTGVVIREWRGEYWLNPTFTGSPTLVRNDVQVNFDWRTGGPAANFPFDNFSARWSRDLFFEAGTYTFLVRADDGLRLFVDGRLVADRWQAGVNEGRAEVVLTRGVHRVVLEYYEATGNAGVALSWTRAEDYPNWRGEYWNNPTLSGAPDLLRNDVNLNFDWGRGSPDSLIRTDGFSVRWTGRPTIAAGTYRFRLRADDGARLWINEQLVFDGWTNAGLDTAIPVTLSASGAQTVRLEYVEQAGDARVQLGWEPLLPTATATATATRPAATTTPTATATATPSLTPSPTATTTSATATATPSPTPTIPVAFVTLTQGQTGYEWVTLPVYTAFASQGEWESFSAMLNGGTSAPLPSGWDPGSQVALGAFGGQQTGQRLEVTIREIVLAGSRLRVTVALTASNGGGTDVMVPHHLVAISAERLPPSALQVEFYNTAGALIGQDILPAR